MTRLGVLAAALLLAIPGVGTASGATRRCSRLRGRDLVNGRRIRVVASGRGDGVIRACVRPNGPVRTVADAVSYTTTTTTFELGHVAGTWLSYAASQDNQYGHDEWVRAFDVLRGRSYEIWDLNQDLGYPGPPEQGAVDRLFLDARGRTAAAISSTPAPGGPTDERIAVFAPDGTELTVDRGTPEDLPPASLAFSHGVVSWTHGGAPRSVRFER